jgi:hypothetical protein
MRDTRLTPSIAMASILVLSVAASPGGAGRGEAAQLSAAAFSTVTWEANPGEFGAAFGSAAAPAGDVNGDGFADILVGAPRQSAGERLNTGAAFLYLGSPEGPLPEPVWVAGGARGGDGFGTALAGADLNADGYGDIVIGAPGYDGAGGLEAGGVFVFYGTPDGLPAAADLVIDGGQAGAAFGSALAVGDVNGDGSPDLLVGAPVHDTNAAEDGAAFLFLGGPSGPDAVADWSAAGEIFDAAFGAAVAMAGDVNGDGYGDAVIGAPRHDALGFYDQGRVYLYYGAPAGGLQREPAWRKDSLKLLAQFGRSVAGGTDVNRDGFSDVLIGAPYFDGGRAFVFHGSASGLAAEADWVVKVRGAQALGWSVAMPGDVNGDGFADVLVGLPTAGDRDQPGEGVAELYAGGSSGVARRAFASLEGEQAGAQFGAAVAASGDVNGDGFADFAVGAPLYDNIEQDSGRVFVHLGSAAAR